MIEVLTLNKEQEEDLITLAKAFLPEYTDVTTETDVENKRHPRCGQKDVGNIEIQQEDIALPYVDWANESDFIRHQRIHWYQFCLTILCERICKNIYPWYKDVEIDLHIRMMKREMIVSDKHPIDFIKQYLEDYINIHEGLKKLYETA